jgi:hypothetical protein
VDISRTRFWVEYGRITFTPLSKLGLPVHRHETNISTALCANLVHRFDPRRSRNVESIRRNVFTPSSKVRPEMPLLSRKWRLLDHLFKINSFSEFHGSPINNLVSDTRTKR